MLVEMPRKTRKQVAKKGIYSIPELRRAFEHIEEVADQMIQKNMTKEAMIKQFRKEWSQTFHKALDKKSADAFLVHRMETKRRVRGGAAPIAGAPLDSTLRPGIYLDQGRIPGADGGLTSTVGGGEEKEPAVVGGGYGSYVQYVDRGFFNPEIAQQYDPVRGQTAFPIAPRIDMGSNAFPPLRGGKRGRKTRKSRGGSAILEQAYMRPIPADVPTSVMFDVQSKLSGISSGLSPDLTQSRPNYQLGSVYPSAVNITMR